MKTEILIIDDNPDIRFLMCNILEENGYTIRSAANFEQATNEIETKLPDLAIVDIKLDKSDASLKVFVGLSNEINNSFLFREIPKYLKPSPLNFLYKFLKKDYYIKQNEIYFSFLDFDVV